MQDKIDVQGIDDSKLGNAGSHGKDTVFGFLRIGEQTIIAVFSGRGFSINP